jgi:hypothetical protein
MNSENRSVQNTLFSICYDEERRLEYKKSQVDELICMGVKLGDESA